MKSIFFVGTRPEAIKLAPLYIKFKNHFPETEIVMTGQHKEMASQILNFFNICPDYDFNIMKQNQSLGQSFSSIFKKSYQLLEEKMPDIIFAQGDTNTALAASLASYYLKIKVAHVEAGLRTKIFYSPFPEEKNRELISRVASFHFAPTKNNVQILRDEGITEDKIFLTGNTVIDSLKMCESKITDNHIKTVEDLVGFTLDENKFILVTGHRRENHGDGINSICDSLAELSKKYENFKFVYPVHMHPNIKDVVYKKLYKYKNIHLLNPLPYEEFVILMKSCYLILTDSGGIQEEAPSMNKPVLLMRESTERPEGVESGSVKVLGSEKDAIVDSVSNLIESKSCYNDMINIKNPYGDGTSSNKIFNIINEHYG